MGDDPVRRTIDEARQAKNLTWKELSLRMGRNPSYMQQYFKYGKPAQLDFRDALKLKSLLNLDLPQVGFPNIPDEIRQSPSATAQGLTEEVAALPSAPDNILVSSRDDLTLYEVKAPVLERYRRGINVGDLLLVDSSPKGLESVASDDAVVVELFDKESAYARTTVLRQFIAPGLLITNGPGENSVINMDDLSLPFEPIIKGKVIRIIHQS